MRFPNRLRGLFNIGLRASSLVFRFLLTFYIAKYIGYEATGLYGLALGAIGFTPAVIGWGLNYFLARDIIGTQPAVAASHVKTRLAVTGLSLAIATALGLVAALALGYEIKAIYLMVIVLVWLEVWAVDIHVSLIAAEKALLANVLVFIRLALWVPVVIALGLAFPAFRTLEIVFAGWLASYVLLIACLLWSLRTWPLAQALRAPLETAWLRKRLRSSWFIWFSDIGMVGLVYIDRYIVSFMLGLMLTGIYTFYWSLANALQTLLATAVIQLALPILYKAHNGGGIEEWHREMHRQLARTALFATVLALCVFIASEVLIHVLSMTELGDHRPIFIMLLLAAVIRSCSDLFNVGLMSLKKDNHYATLNMLGIGLSVAMTFAMIHFLGFTGAGVASLATAVIVAGVRAGFLVLFSRKTVQAANKTSAAP